MTRLLDWLERRLGRVTSTGEMILEVDGLRAVALLLVLGHHLLGLFAVQSGRWGAVSFPADWGRVAESSPAAQGLFAGFIGVDLFFVISGFVLGLPFARQYLAGGAGVDVRAFYRRRLIRLEPPYLIAVSGFFAMKVLMDPEWPRLLPHLAATLFYQHGLVFGTWSEIEPLFWSLEVEIQFYLLAPLLASLFMGRGRAVWLWAAALAASCGWALAAEAGMNSLRWGLAAYLGYFLAGFGLARLYVTQPRRESLLADAGAVALAAWLFAEADLAAELARPWHMPFSIAAWYLCLYNGRLAPRVLRWRPLVLTGGMSYTLYLYHMNLIQLLGRATFRRFAEWPVELHFLIATAFVVVAGAGIFAFTERPFMMRRTWQNSIR